MKKTLAFFLAVLVLISLFAGCEKRPGKNDIVDFLESIDDGAEISFWTLYPSENEQKLPEEDKKMFIDSIQTVSRNDIEWNKSMAGPAPAEFSFVIRLGDDEERAFQHTAGCVEIQRDGVSWLIKSEEIYDLMNRLIAEHEKG